jgi:hypothetical protein
MKPSQKQVHQVYFFNRKSLMVTETKGAEQDFWCSRLTFGVPHRIVKVHRSAQRQAKLEGEALRKVLVHRGTDVPWSRRKELAAKGAIGGRSPTRRGRP